jgi:hypothetical protein
LADNNSIIVLLMKLSDICDCYMYRYIILFFFRNGDISFCALLDIEFAFVVANGAGGHRSQQFGTHR